MAATILKMIDFDVVVGIILVDMDFITTSFLRLGVLYIHLMPSVITCFYYKQLS